MALSEPLTLWTIFGRAFWVLIDPTINIISTTELLHRNRSQERWQFDANWEFPGNVLNHLSRQKQQRYRSVPSLWIQNLPFPPRLRHHTEKLQSQSVTERTWGHWNTGSTPGPSFIITIHFSALRVLYWKLLKGAVLQTLGSILHSHLFFPIKKLLHNIKSSLKIHRTPERYAVDDELGPGSALINTMHLDNQRECDRVLALSTQQDWWLDLESFYHTHLAGGVRSRRF